MKPFEGIDRRAVLASLASLGATAGAAGLGVAAAAANPDAAEAAAKPRREAAPFRRPHGELEEATVDDLQRRMESGELSAEKLVQGYLDRIAALDGPSAGGPALRSVLEINSQALSIARDLDRERKAQGARGALHGIPVLLKDNIDTGDRMATSAGSLALAAHRAARDAFLVERLRAHGAVVLGKTNLSEWANFRSTRSSSGWSSRGGQTRNPYVLDRNPCGSSAGSGAAAAASLATLTVGTETDGSIVCPSTLCGLVGVKPTVGLVSRTGVIPISASQDTAGPMTRTVRDAAHLLTALLGEDGFDPATHRARTASGSAGADYARALEGATLKGARLGVARQYFGKHPGVDALIEGAIALLKAAGAEIIDPVEIPADSEYAEAEYEVLLYEFKHGLNAYLATTEAAVTTRTLAELIAWNEAHRDTAMPWFGQEIFLQAQAKGPLTESAYVEARARCVRLAKEQGIEATIAKHRLDAIVAPTGQPAWVTDWINGDHYTGSCSTPAAVAGSPHVTVPAGLVHGLPVGLSFFGKDWSEVRLLQIAYAFEREAQARKPPQYLPTLPS